MQITLKLIVYFTIIRILTIQENIEVRPITRNPGLLPFKIGVAKLKTNSWTLIKNINLNSLIEEYNIIKQAAVNLNYTLYKEKSEKWYQTEMHNYHYIVNHLQSEIDALLEQFIPQYIQHRRKRGLINGLGSIIKILTGNMDQEDANRINQQKKQLETMQSRNAILQKLQVSLSIEAIANFNETISQLKHNQLLLKSRILQIEQIIKDSEKHEQARYDLLLISIIYTQITNSLYSIIRILTNIQTSVTFAKLNVMHPLILEPHFFENELKSIMKDNLDYKLPLNPETQNILQLENLVDIKAYQDNQNIIFVLEIPLVQEQNYNFYHLYSLPMTNNNQTSLLIPQSKYLLQNEQYYSGLSTVCTLIKEREYLCKNVDMFPITPLSPCEVQIVALSKYHENCKPIPFYLSKSKIQSIEFNNWIVIVTKQTKIVTTCDNDQNSMFIQGTNLIRLNKNCHVQIDNEHIQFLQSNTFYKEQVPILNYNINLTKQIKGFHELEIESISLDEANHIMTQLIQNKNEIETTIPAVINNISTWTLLLYIFLICIIAYVSSTIIKKRCGKETKEKEVMKKEDSAQKSQRTSCNFRLRDGDVI